MTLKAVHADSERRRWPLSERIVDEKLGSYHHVPRQRQRPRSATADAETLQARAANVDEDNDDDAGHPQPDDHAARRKPRRPNDGTSRPARRLLIALRAYLSNASRRLVAR